MSRSCEPIDRFRTQSWWLLALLVAGCASTGGGGDAPAATGSDGDGAPPAVTAEPAPAVAAAEPAASAPAGTPADAYLADEAALKRGSQLFRAVCTGYCHSSEGAGRDAPDVFDCQSSHGTSDADVFEVVSKGVPDTQMQAFGGKLPDADLWRIVAYIRTRTTC
jgi:mono/diheme cytochrome c family protein